MAVAVRRVEPWSTAMHRLERVALEVGGPGGPRPTIKAAGSARPGGSASACPAASPGALAAEKTENLQASPRACPIPPPIPGMVTPPQALPRPLTLINRR